MFYLISQREIRAHVSRLSPFLYDPLKVDPEAIAFRDKDEYVVESIVDHKGTKGRAKSTFTFQVRWLGFSAEWDEWLPYEELKDTGSLHRYLFDHGMASFLTKKQLQEVQTASDAE